ncbi:MAG: hypothetical protein HYX74_04765 [Acidobacteria bacterium]|nr:hypothetical protein [Acidobacteriota bacterium]
MFHTYTIWIANIALLALILIRGIANRMLSSYVIFYAYVAFAFFTAVGQLVVGVLWGRTSTYYYYGFHIPNLVMPALQFWILWDLYQRIIGNHKTAVRNLRRSVTLILAMTVPVAWGVISLQESNFFNRYHALTLSLQIAACLLIYKTVCSRHDLALGRNLKGLLSGLSLMVAFQGINFTRFLFGVETYQSFGFFVPFIYFLALIVFAYTLWSHEPMVYFKSAGWQQTGSMNERLQKVNQQLQQALKSLVLPR